MSHEIDNQSKEQRKQKEQAKTLENAGLGGAASEAVQRYGSANREFLVGYSGNDFESGQVLKKSLKGVSESKVNPDYAYNNIHQQAGFSAEVESASRKNAEYIISGEKKRRSRTDDVGKQGYGNTEIGGTNDQLYDLVDIDANEKAIPGSASQSKFVGDGGNHTLDKLISNKYQKYFDNDVPIEVPSDYYDGIREAAAQRAEKLQKQIDRLKKNGAGKEIIDAKEKQLQKLGDIRDGKSIRKSNVSSREAVFARKHPELATAKDIAKVSHRAGVDAAKTGAVIAGTMSLIRNLVAVAKGDKEPDEAALAVVKDTAGGTAVSYGTAFIGSTLSGVMKNAGEVVVENGTKVLKPNVYIQAAGKTNLPGQIVTATIEAGKTLGKYFKGDIDGVECLTELGEKGTGMVAAAMFSALGTTAAASMFGKAGFVIGQLVVPIPVIGGFIGGMVGYALSSACYGQLVSALKEAKLAREERLRIEAECAEAVQMIREYRREMEAAISRYLLEYMSTFQEAFDDIKTALNIGDIDGFIAGANSIIMKLGGKPQFSNFTEFDALMEGKEILKL
jgi:hypothetical protein